MIDDTKFTHIYIVGEYREKSATVKCIVTCIPIVRQRLGKRVPAVYMHEIIGTPC
jgi:hypothetical protein